MNETMNKDKELEARIRQLEEENKRLKEQLNRAKDPTPVERPRFENVKRLAGNQCLNLERVKRGFKLSLGNLKRVFKRLKDVWEVLTQEGWELSELFPPEKPKAPKGCCKFCFNPIQWIGDFNPNSWGFENWRAINSDGSLHKCKDRIRQSLIKRDSLDGEAEFL